VKKIIYLLLLLLVSGLGLLYYYRVEYPKLPGQLDDLNRRIEARNEKLISAEIIASELDLVANLIDRNLAISRDDSLAQGASLAFLEYMTGLIQNHHIILVTLEPDRKSSSRHDYVRTSYDVVVECTYTEFGELLNDIEKSDRLITIEEFKMDNQINNVGRRSKRSWDSHPFEFTLSTLTLIKQSS
jgi:archaellum biogenesis ATPase FlaH